MKVFGPGAPRVSHAFEGSVTKRGKGKAKGVMDGSDEEWGVNTASSTKKRGKKPKVHGKQNNVMSFTTNRILFIAAVRQRLPA